MPANAIGTLVIDDDPDIRELLCDGLASVGIAVTAAANGCEALAALRAGARPTSILLDLMMPVLDGWGFLRELALDPRLATIPVVTMTASSIEHDRVRGHPLVRARLLKPFAVEEVMHLIRPFAS